VLLRDNATGVPALTGGAFGLQDAEAQHAAAYQDARAAVEGADATAKLAVVVRALPLQPRASAIYPCSPAPVPHYPAFPRQCHYTRAFVHADMSHALMC